MRKRMRDADSARRHESADAPDTSRTIAEFGDDNEEWLFEDELEDE